MPFLFNGDSVIGEMPKRGQTAVCYRTPDGNLVVYRHAYTIEEARLMANFELDEHEPHNRVLIANDTQRGLVRVS